MTPDLYATLGVAKDAPAAAIRKAYRRKAKSAHPDGGGSPEEFAVVCLAADVLGDDARRARYDSTGQADAAEPDTVLADAMNMVMQAIQHVVGEIMRRGGDLGSFDVVSDAKKKVAGDIKKARQMEASQKNEAAELRTFAKRFKPKRGKPNRIAPMLLSQADVAERGAAMAVAKVPAMEMAIAILSDHDFDFTAPQPTQAYYGQSPNNMPPWMLTT